MGQMNNLCFSYRRKIPQSPNFSYDGFTYLPWLGKHPSALYIFFTGYSYFFGIIISETKTITKTKEHKQQIKGKEHENIH